MSNLDDNPFRVLGVAPTATTREIEREAAKLLGMLELGVGDAGTYPTPLGPRPRTAEAVRAAAAVLRDPRRRLSAELWIGAADEPRAAAAPSTTTDPVRWPGALRATGWGPR